MKIIKIHIIVSVIISMLCFTASAAFVQSGDYTIDVYGKTSEPEQTVSIQVFKPNKSLIDLLSAHKSEYTNIVAYQNEIKSDKDGSYLFRIKTDGESGIYNALLNDGTGSTSQKLIYSNPDANKNALNVVNNTGTYEEFARIFDEYQFDLGFYSELYEKVNKEDVLRFIYNQLSVKKFDVTDSSAAKKLFNKAVVAAAFVKGIDINIFDYADDIGLANSKLKDLYCADFVTITLQKEISEIISNTKLSNAIEFDEKIIEAFVLGTVYRPNGYINAKTVIDTFKDEIGITDVSDSVCQKIVGNKYSNYAELKSDINSNSKTQTSSSGGGGGTTSNVAPNVAVGPISVTESVPNTNEIFDDISNVTWAKEAIISLYNDGIINGKQIGKFCPNDNITREEFTKLVVLAFLPDCKETDVGFLDVKTTDWYYTFIAKAYTDKIIAGYDNGMFGVGKNITRQDMAVIVCRALKLSNKEESFKFDDDLQISDYARSSVYTLYNLGVVNGVTDTMYMPTDFATRAEAAKIIYLLR